MTLSLRWCKNPTRDCLKSKIHQETLETGFHGRSAHPGAAAARGLVNPLDVETNESFDWIVRPRGRNNERGQRLTSETWLQKPRFTLAAHFAPIEAEADPGVLEARRDGSYSEPALSGALPFILPPRRGRARLHTAASKFPTSWSLQFPVEIVKIKQLDDSAGGPGLYLMALLLS